MDHWHMSGRLLDDEALAGLLARDGEGLVGCGDALFRFRARTPGGEECAGRSGTVVLSLQQLGAPDRAVYLVDFAVAGPGADVDGATRDEMERASQVILRASRRCVGEHLFRRAQELVSYPGAA